MSDKIKGWHFSEKDTPQQRSILRSSRIAQKVRRDFPEGTRIKTSAGATGTVRRHVPGTSADGGTLFVAWDSGVDGRVTLTSGAITRIENDA